MTTTDSYIADAFQQVCDKAEESEDRFVSLYCLSQLDACGWDGEEAQSRFGEVDGAEDYFVTIESSPGSQESRGSRHYE